MTTSGGHPDFSAPAHAIAPDDDYADPATRQAHRRTAGRPRRRVAVVAAACLMGVALVANDWTAALDATQRADLALDETRAELGITEGELAAALATAEAHEAALAGEREGPEDQARLAALQACVTGVAHALNQVSVHDSRVADTLRDIESTCADAGVDL